MKKSKMGFFIFLASLLFMLPSYNKYWAPYDEGNYLEPATLVMAGMVPYRDFFLPMYPPAHTYILAGLFKVFGINLLIGRIYSIIVVSIICTTVFYIARKIAGLLESLIAFIACLVTLTCLGMASIPRAIWPGVMLSLLAIFAILNFIEKDKSHYLILSGFFVGLATMFRHDIGFLTIFASLIGLLVYSIYLYQGEKEIRSLVVKRAVKLWILYMAIPFLFTAALAIWLYKVNALEDAKSALFTLPAKFNKWGRIPFPGFSFDFSMIFHRGCLFIRRNKFYIPPIVCGASAILFISELITKKRLDKRHISPIILILLGIFYLQQLIFRTDDGHLAASFAPSAILFGGLFSYRHDFKWKFFSILKVILISYVSLLMILLVYHSTERFIKDIYVKPFVKKTIEPARFERGSLYIPDDVRDNFVSLARYIEDNTEEGEKIYIGHLKHKVLEMGWFDLLYFMTGRLPGVKYFILIPGLQARDDIQEEMILSLKDNNVRVLLLRDFGKSDLLGPLDKYIREEYRLDKIMDSYHIYVKR